VGHDWGGFVAWWVALTYPEQIEKLVVINAPHPVVFKTHLLASWKQKLNSWYMFYMQIPKIPEISFRFLNELFAKQLQHSALNPEIFAGESLQKYRKSWFQPGAIDAMFKWYKALFQTRPKKKENYEVTVPTLLIWGAQDSFFAKELAKPSIELCKTGQLQMIDDGSHWVTHEKVEQISQLIFEFIHQKS